MSDTNFFYAVQSTVSNGSVSFSIYDRYEREVRRVSLGPNGKWLYAQTQYDAKGRVFQASIPRYDTSGQTFWNTTIYDTIGRPIEVQRSKGPG